MEPIEHNKNLGKKGIDRMSGITGTINGYFQTIHGSDQYQIITEQTISKDGVLNKSETLWVDTGRVDVEE